MFDMSYVYGNNTTTSHFKINFVNTQSLHLIVFSFQNELKTFTDTDVYVVLYKISFIFIVSNYFHDLFLGQLIYSRDYSRITEIGNSLQNVLEKLCFRLNVLSGMVLRKNVLCVKYGQCSVIRLIMQLNLSLEIEFYFIFHSQ